MKYVIIFETDREIGGEGFRIKKNKWMNPIGGFGLAHDLLEHWPKDKGTVEEEFMALGAGIYVRDFGYAEHELNPRGNRKDHAVELAGEISFQANQEGTDNPLKKPPGHRKPFDEQKDLQDILDRIPLEVIKLKRSEEIPKEHSLGESKEIQKALGWIKHGFIKGKYRYREIPHHNLTHAFVEITRHVDKLIKSAYEGQQYTVTVDIRRDIGYIDWNFEEKYDDY